MATMFEIKDNKATFTATANEFLRGQAYTRAKALASEHNCVATDIIVKIDGKTEKRLKVTAKTKTDRDAFVNAYEPEYAKAHKAYTKAKGKVTPTEKTKKPLWQKELKALAGKGSSANKDAAAILRAHGIVPNGKEWDYWKSIR